MSQSPHAPHNQPVSHGKRNRSESFHNSSHSLNGEGVSARPSKVSKWNLEAIRPGEELSFIADANDSEMEEMHDDMSFIDPPSTAPMERMREGSLSSIASYATELGADPPDSESFKRSHEVLRAKLRRGERLQEADFEKGEECSRVAQRSTGSQVRTNLFCVGGSGSVYRMRLIADPLVVCAMKQVPLHLQAGELEQFEQDVRLAYGHQHPNIMPLYDVCLKRMDGTSKNLWQLCIYMHYADRGSLASITAQKEDGRMPVLFISGVAVQMLDALMFLHNTAHVCHRDLKPSNILVRSDGRVMLQDFGNSRQLGGTFHSMRTYVGCQVYMSPERINGVTYTCKSDVWALALILMECLVGKFPYEKDNGGEEVEGNDLFYMLERIVDDQVPFHQLTDVGVPDMFAQFLRRTLLKDQNARPSSEELLCSKMESQLVASVNFESGMLSKLLTGHGIGVVCTTSEDADVRMLSSRMFAIAGAAQRAVKAGLTTPPDDATAH